MSDWRRSTLSISTAGELQIIAEQDLLPFKNRLDLLLWDSAHSPHELAKVLDKFEGRLQRIKLFLLLQQHYDESPVLRALKQNSSLSEVHCDGGALPRLITPLLRWPGNSLRKIDVSWGGTEGHQQFFEACGRSTVLQDLSITVGTGDDRPPPIAAIASMLGKTKSLRSLELQWWCRHIDPNEVCLVGLANALKNNLSLRKLRTWVVKERFCLAETRAFCHALQQNVHLQDLIVFPWKTSNQKQYGRFLGVQDIADGMSKTDAEEFVTNLESSFCCLLTSVGDSIYCLLLPNEAVGSMYLPNRRMSPLPTIY